MTPREIAASALALRANMAGVIDPLRHSDSRDAEEVLNAQTLAIGGLAAAVDVLAGLVAELAEQQ